jgi:hypothetical protein
LRRLALACLTSLALFTVWTNLSFAQGGVGTTTGTVPDPKGLSVPGATVPIHNTDTNRNKRFGCTMLAIFEAKGESRLNSMPTVDCSADAPQAHAMKED